MNFTIYRYPLSVRTTPLGSLSFRDGVPIPELDTKTGVDLLDYIRGAKSVFLPDLNIVPTDLTNEEHQRALMAGLPCIGYQAESDAQVIAKYSPDQPRDEQGKWTDGITAYHGTPYTISRFSMEHIGEGQGAQTFGWGLYFAEEPQVARDYSETIGGGRTDPVNTITLDGVRIRDIAKEQGIDPKVAGTAATALHMQSLETGPGILRYNAAHAEVLNDAERAKFRAAADWLDTLQGKEMKTLPPEPGKIYTVKLDVKPEELLDLDKPLSEQSESVRRALLPLAQRLAPKEGRYPSEIKGDELYEGLAWDKHYQSSNEEYISAGRSKERLASEALLKVGIPGLRYLDAGSRRYTNQGVRQSELSGKWIAEYTDGTGKISHRSFTTKSEAEQHLKTIPERGTRNIVMFDDSRIHITHADGKPVTEPSEIAKAMEEIRKDWDESAHPRVQSGVHGGEFTSGTAVEDVPNPLPNVSSQAFAKGFSLARHPGIRTELTRLEPRIIENRPSLLVEGDLLNDRNELIGKFGRRFSTNLKGELFVHNTSFTVTPAFQHEAIGTDFYAQSERFYQSIGVKYVVLEANSKVGAYAWALQGYDFAEDDDGQGQAARDFSRELKRRYELGAMGEDEYMDASSRLAACRHSWEYATFSTPSLPQFGRNVMLRWSNIGGWTGVKQLDPNDEGYKVGAEYQRLKLLAQAATP